MHEFDSIRTTRTSHFFRNVFIAIVFLAILGVGVYATVIYVVANWTVGAVDKATRACTPGQVIECPLSNGVKGTQTCTPDGSRFDPCGLPK
jgi:hypothetical protein